MEFLYVYPLADETRRRSLLDGPGDDAAVVAAEAEAIGDGTANAGFACHVGDVVEVAVGVGRLIVDRGMEDAALDAEDGGDHLDGAAGAKEMADHTLGAGDGQLLGVRAEDGLDGLGF